MEQQTTSIINLDDIEVSKTNGIFRRKQAMTPEALQELANSIGQHGVIQPVLLRPNPEVPGKYILICGERRYQASRIAGKNDIPAYIKEVTAAVAFVLQITENVQREDVHALDEAKGYKFMLTENEQLTTAELALRFGKSETYILQRLKLNELIKEIRKDFYEDKLSLGHAILLARLTPADQRLVVEELVNRGDYGTVTDLRDFINRHVMNNLSSAPFDKKDEALYKKAGACMNCVKRSGASPLLFAEIKEKDKCFDRNCFFIKCHRFLINKTKEVIETQPEIVFLRSYNDPSDEVMQLLGEHKITPLREYDDFNEHDNGGKKVKGLWISGNHAGHVESIYLKKKVESAGSASLSTKVQIEKIRQRMDRGKELDREKVYEKILESLRKHSILKKDTTKKLMTDEEVMLWYMVLDKAGYQLKNELRRFIGVTKDNPEKLYNLLKHLKLEDKAYMLRKVMMDQYGGNYPDSDYGFIIRKIAVGYGDVDIKTFEREQHEIREKREGRAKERIKVLQQNKNPDTKKV